MSIARIHTVNKSQKDQGKCGKCGDALPKGSAYRWYSVGFRSNHKYVRCTKSECSPLASELESSKLAGVYAAQESFDVSDAQDISDIESAVQEVAEEVRGIAEEYTEAATNPNTGAVFNTEAESRGEELSSWADELESWTYDEEKPDPDDFDETVKDNADAYDYALEEWLEEARQAAQEAVDSCPL